MFFCSLAFSEDFNLICEGERKVRNLSSKEFNVTNFESILLKINKNSMDYIGLNSGRSYFLSNRLTTNCHIICIHDAVNKANMHP